MIENVFFTTRMSSSSQVRHTFNIMIYHECPAHLQYHVTFPGRLGRRLPPCSGTLLFFTRDHLQQGVFLPKNTPCLQRRPSSPNHSIAVWHVRLSHREPLSLPINPCPPTRRGETAPLIFSASARTPWCSASARTPQILVWGSKHRRRGGGRWTCREGSEVAALCTIGHGFVERVLLDLCTCA